MDANRYPLNIRDPFWTLFFTSSLTMRFVGGSSCFCLTDPVSGNQTIMVIPVGEFSTLPATEQVLRHFPVNETGRKLYDSAVDLPVEYSIIRKAERLNCEEIHTRRRHVRILTPDFATPQVGEEIGRLAFMHFWQAPLLQIERIRLAVGGEQIWFMSQLMAASRVLIHLKPGEGFRFRGDTLQFTFGGVAHLVPVPNQARTA
jgi:hypothetical protein